MIGGISVSNHIVIAMKVKRSGQSVRIKSPTMIKNKGTTHSGKTANCPIFNPEEIDYDHWRKDALLWKAITNLPKTKQGPTAYLAIRGSAKKSVFHMDMDTLKLKSGFDELIKLLDELYLPAKFENEYKHFDDLFNFVRKPEELVTIFCRDWHAKLLNFESIAGKMSSKMAALMLLSASKLTKSQRQITKAMIGNDITYERIRGVINVICDVEANAGDEIAISSETFVARRFPWSKNTSRSYRGSSSGTSSYMNSKRHGENSSGTSSYRSQSRERDYEPSYKEREYAQFKNCTKDGKVTTCGFCGSMYHYQRDCEDLKRLKELKLQDKSDKPFKATFDY